MSKKRSGQKLLSMLLAVVMLVSMAPVSVFAEETGPMPEAAAQAAAQPEETPAGEETSAPAGTQPETPAPQPDTPGEAEQPAETPQEGEPAPDPEQPETPDGETPDGPEEAPDENPAEETLPGESQEDTQEEEAEEEIEALAEETPVVYGTVYVTLSNRGDFAASNGRVMVEVPVTTPLADGVRATADDVMKAFHEQYCPGGYAYDEQAGVVSRLWGVESPAVRFFVGGMPLNGGIADAAIRPNEYLYAAILSDTTYYSDLFTVVSYGLQSVVSVQGSEPWMYIKGYNAMTSYSVASDQYSLNVPVLKNDDLEIGYLTGDGGFHPLEKAPTTNVSAFAYTANLAPGEYLLAVRGTVAQDVVVNPSTGETQRMDCRITPWYGRLTVTEQPRLGSVKIFADYQKNLELHLEEPFDPMKTEGYHLRVPDGRSVFFEATMQDGEKFPDYKLCAYAPTHAGGLGVEDIGSGAATYQGIVGVGIVPKVGHSITPTVNYVFQVSYYPVLKQLEAGDIVWDKNPVGNRDGYIFDQEYTAYVRPGAQTVEITATGLRTYNELSVNGETVENGQTLQIAWDGTAKDVTVRLTHEFIYRPTDAGSFGTERKETTESVYTIHLRPLPAESAPFFLHQPQGGEYCANVDKPAAMTVEAYASGELTYQWYCGKDGADPQPVEGATEASYTPGVSEAGDFRYFCRVTNTVPDGQTADSDTALVLVHPDPTPTVWLKTEIPSFADMGLDEETMAMLQKTEGFYYNVGDKATPIEVGYSSPVEGGEWSFVWKHNLVNINNDTTPNNAWTREEMSATLIPNTARVMSKFGMRYRCFVTYTVNGRAFTVQAPLVYVFVKAAGVETPEITQQPLGHSYTLEDRISAINIKAIKQDRGDLIFTWYCNDVNSTEGGVEVASMTKAAGTQIKPDTALRAETASFTPPKATEPETRYYYCVVTNSLHGKESSVVSDVVRVHFGNADDIYGDVWDGQGTEEKPFLLQNQEDLVELAELVSAPSEVDFEGAYFRMTCDLELPTNWKGIGSSGGKTNPNPLCPFSGTLDGGGFTLTYAYGGRPLFNYVREATVKNLNIYAPWTPYNGLVAAYTVDYGKDNEYGEGEGGSEYPGCPDTVDIVNVTIKSGSVIKNSGFIGGYASGGNVVNITGCTVEPGVKIGYDLEKNAPADSSRIGSFAGDFNGRITNCASAATVYGSSYVGGIVGGKGQTMGPYTIRNCTFTGEVIATGKFAGGIAGGGYSGSAWGVASAPLTPCAQIYDCTVTGSVTGGTCVGGVFGGEEGVESIGAGKDASIVVRNTFKGASLKATDPDGISGGVIGYLNSINQNSQIEDNVFYGDDILLGIGKIRTVFTTAEHETASGAIYKKGGRNDDPLGADADKLARPGEMTPKRVENLIDAIGEPVTLESQYAIEVAQRAYNSLGADRQAQVANASKLTAAVAALDRLKAQAVEQLIDAVGTVTLDSEAAVNKAVEAYNALSAAQQKQVANEGKLSAAVARLSTLKVARAEALIEAVGGEITLDSEKDIVAARSYVTALAKAERDKVSNLDKLEKAEKELEVLKQKEAKGTTKTLGRRVTRNGVSYEISDATAAVIDAIDALLNPKSAEDALPENFGTLTPVQLESILAACRAYDALSDDEKLFVENYEDFQPVLDKLGASNHADDLTGVAVSGMSWNVKLIAQPILADDSVKQGIAGHLGADSALLSYYNLQFVELLSGKSYQPQSPVTMRIPAPALDGYTSAVVLHVREDGTHEYIQATVKDGYLEFIGQDAGSYGVVGYNETTALDDEATPLAAAPQSGFPWVWVAVIVVAAAGLCWLLLVRRKKDEDEEV